MQYGANQQSLGDYSFILCHITPKPGWSLSHASNGFTHYPQLSHISPTQQIFLRERLLQHFMGQPTELYPEMGNLLSEILLTAAEEITNGIKTSLRSWHWEIQAIRRLFHALLPNEKLPQEIDKALAHSIARIHACLVNDGPWQHLPSRPIPHLPIQDCHAIVGKMKRISLHFSLCGRKIRALAFRKNILLAMVRHPAHFYVLKLPWNKPESPSLDEAQQILDLNPMALQIMGVSGLSKTRHPILPWKTMPGFEESELFQTGGPEVRFRTPIF